MCWVPLLTFKVLPFGTCGSVPWRSSVWSTPTFDVSWPFFLMHNWIMNDSWIFILYARAGSVWKTIWRWASHFLPRGVQSRLVIGPGPEERTVANVGLKRESTKVRGLPRWTGPDHCSQGRWLSSVTSCCHVASAEASLLSKVADQDLKRGQWPMLGWDERAPRCVAYHAGRGLTTAPKGDDCRQWPHAAMLRRDIPLVKGRLIAFYICPFHVGTELDILLFLPHVLLAELVIFFRICSMTLWLTPMLKWTEWNLWNLWYTKEKQK